MTKVSYLQINGSFTHEGKELTIDEFLKVLEVTGIVFTGDWKHLDENRNEISKAEYFNK